MEETKSFKDTTLIRQHSDLGTPLNRPTTPLMLTKITRNIASRINDESV